MWEEQNQEKFESELKSVNISWRREINTKSQPSVSEIELGNWFCLLVDRHFQMAFIPD